MKRLTIFILTLPLCLMLSAQKTPVEKYELIPASMQQVYLDHVQSFPSRVISINNNQYFGQVNKKHRLYGYGRYINNDGSEIIGQFRDDQLLFGITFTQNSALVGSRENYASYSLATGKLEFIYHADEQVVVDTRNLLDYGFVSMKYSNGDQYMGEVFQQKRHGYGIYYYANGDIWYGQYNNDVRSGFGAFFAVDGYVQIGEWQGEDDVRVIDIKRK